ncbi:MAG: ABC transporter ATP-binding protein [Gemmatimonadota bacterium]
MKELRTLLPYVRPYRRGILAGLALVVVANAFSIAAPKLLGMAIDALERPDTNTHIIVSYAGLVVLTALIGGAARYGMRELLNGLSRRIETDLRNSFFSHLIRLDASFFAGTRTGDLMSRATNDVLAVRMAVGPAVMYTVNTFVITLFALTLMLRVSPLLTLLALLPMVAVPFVTTRFGRIIHERFERIQAHLGVRSTMVQENLAGARIVRAYVQEEPQKTEFDDLNQEYLERNMALARASGIFRPALTLLTGIGMVVVFWFGGRLVVAGQVSVGNFVAFTFYLGMLTWPMIALGWVINLFQRGAASMRRLNLILGTEPAIREPEPARRLENVGGDLEFRDVSFHYPGTERIVLDHVSFRVPPGTTTALVGPTGAGKSTVVALLARLYDPQEGTILLDGEAVDGLALEQVRAAIGVVPQDAFLFSESIQDNIAFGIPDGDAVEERVRAAASIAQLDEAIAVFPHGFDTRLGERGINLSGGQRQRTTLARAIARDPEVLVLDDALSAVDTHTERRILSGLRDVLQDRTAIIISHRITAVMEADQILVLENGRIVERGTHAELINRSGVYATLLRRQILEEGLADPDAGDPMAAAEA